EAPRSAPSVSRWRGFFVLPENRVAVRAARSVYRALIAGKRTPANPLVLHGPPGTGKSRLIGALSEQLSTSVDGLAAQVVSAGDLARSPDESFTDRALFDADLLVLEDIQHLTDRTADSACDLLDRRASRRRATVLTASAGPSGLTHLPHRLTSRLAAGLVVQLEPLTITSRRVLLAEVARAKGIRLTDDALAFLVEQTAGGGVRSALGLLQNLAQVGKSVPGPLGRLEVERTLAESGIPTLAQCD